MESDGSCGGSDREVFAPSAWNYMYLLVRGVIVLSTTLWGGCVGEWIDVWNKKVGVEAGMYLSRAIDRHAQQAYLSGSSVSTLILSRPICKIHVTKKYCAYAQHEWRRLNEPGSIRASIETCSSALDQKNRNYQQNTCLLKSTPLFFHFCCSCGLIQ